MPSAHTARAHARFSPSGSDRWLNCPSSIPFTEALVAASLIPDPEQDRGGAAAQRGTFAHEVGETALRAGTPAESFTHEDEFVQRMVRAYLRAVQGLLASLRDDFGVPNELMQVMIESRVSLNRDVWGSIDFALLVRDIHVPLIDGNEQAPWELWVIDLKTGHRAVGAERNTQLMTYAAAIAKRERWNITRANLWIVQPEDTEEPKTWTCSVDDLKAHVSACNRAVAQALRWDPRNPDLRYGDHCQYCPATGHCPAFRNAALAPFAGEVSAVTSIATSPTDNVVSLPPVGSLTDEQKAGILRAEPFLRRWLDAVRDDVLATHRAPPGFKIVAANSRRRWRDESRAFAYFQAHAPDLIRQQLPTLTEARRALTPETMDNLTESPEGAPTIVPESDPRPALPSPAQVFDDAAASP